MPTLLDKIKGNIQQVKRGTQLFDVVNESVTNQATRQGMPAGGVVSPMMAAGMGVSEDQAKMAGSKAQLDNVQRQAIDQSQQQARVEERKQARTEKTAEEQQKATQAQSLAQFGSNVQQIIKNATAKAVSAASTTPASLNTDVLKAKIPDEARYNELLPLITKALAGNATAEELAKLANAPELAIARGTTPDEIQKNVVAALEAFRTTQSAAIIANAQQAFPDKLLVKELSDSDIQSLGFSTREEMLSTLGLTASDNLTLQDLQTAVANLQNANYSDVRALQEAANDPNLSPAARQEARNRLRELGTSGARATEDDFNKVNQAVQSADKLTIDGKEWTVDELLSDKGLSAVITNYLNNAEYAADLKLASPELADFIEKNKTALAEASKALASDVKDLAKIQSDNAALGKGHQAADGSAVTISDDFNRAIYGSNWGTTTGTPLEATEAHRILQGNYDPQWQQAYSDLLTTLAKSDPALARTFANYTYDELVKAGLTKDVNALSRYKEYLTQSKSYASNPDTEQAIRSIFPTIDGKNGINELLNKVKLLNASGLGPKIDSGIIAILDPDGNGQVDMNDKNKLAAIKKALDALLLPNGSAITPDKLVNGKAPNLTEMVKALEDAVTIAEGSSSYSQFASALTDDKTPGKVSAEEITGIMGQAGNAATLQSLYDTLNKSGIMTPEANTAITKQLQDMTKKEEISSINQLLGTTFSNETDLNSYIQRLTNPNDLNSLASRISKLASESKPPVKAELESLYKLINDRFHIRLEEQPKENAAAAKVAADRQTLANQQREAMANMGGAKQKTYSSKPTFALPGGYHWASKLVGRQTVWYAAPDRR